jgi:lipooligosaccharide transport system permease protein
MALSVTSFVRTINHFNFYFTGFISPMFFFSGVVFPISNLPVYIRPFAEAIPLTHSVRLTRAVCAGQFHWYLLLDTLYIIVFILAVGYFAVKRLKKRLVF